MIFHTDVSCTVFVITFFITSSISINVTSLSHFEAAFQGKCSAPNNPCLQLCTELSDNAFECHCHPTYILSIDGYSCLLTNSSESIPQLPLQEVEEMQNYYYNGSDGGGSSGGTEQMYTSLDDVHLIDSTCISFAETYVVLPILSNAYINDNIYIEFKPLRTEGLLLLTGESYELINDYIIISLEDGYVVFRYDCGTGPGIIKSMNQVNLNEWNTLNIIRYKWNGWIQLNNYHYNHGKSQGLFSRITFRIPVFLGGANTSLTYPYFSGQIRKLLINKENYLSDTVSNCCSCLHGGICVSNECSCPFGYSGKSCELFVDVQIPFFNETSYLKYKSLLSGTTTFLTLDLVVNPLSHDGIIVYSGRENLDTDMTDYICLLINQGYVEFYADLGNGVGVAKSQVKLGLDTWHKISVTISSRLINLEINGVGSSNHIPGAFNQLTLDNNWYLGGIPNTEWLVNNKINIFTGFYGCIQKVLVNDALVNLMGSALIGINIENCQHECNNKPCGHNGFCIPDLANYKCTQQIQTTSVINIPKFTGDSYIKFVDPEVLERFEGTKLRLSLDLKTSHSSGLIFYTSYNQHVNNDYLKIYLQDGYLNLAISLGSGYKFIKYAKLRLHDDQWHSVVVTRNEQEMRVSVDNAEPVVNYIPGKLSNFNIHDGVFIGGIEEVEVGRKQSELGFIGCVKNLSVDDYVLTFEDTVSRNLNFC